MNNTNEILERILLNMSYDSKKTLTENRELILEEQQIPTTMNQIMQFQTWVWKNVDKLGDPDKANKTKKYTTKLCDQPCWPFNRRINGKMYSGAIDGRFGGNTKKLWNTYKEKYKKANPTWNADDIKTREKVTGQKIPTTKTQIKNFQRYIYEVIDKADSPFLTPDDELEARQVEVNMKDPTHPSYGHPPNPLIKTKDGEYVRHPYWNLQDANKRGNYTLLCGKFNDDKSELYAGNCGYDTAIDGNWGPITKFLWEKYKDEYKENNVLWSTNNRYVYSEYMDRKEYELVSSLNLNFWIGNPSGYNIVDSKPKPKEHSGSFQSMFCFDPDKCDRKWYWNKHNDIYPYPVPYTQETLSKLKTLRKYQEEENRVSLSRDLAKNALKNKRRYTTQITTRASQISDRLGPSGDFQAQKQIEDQTYFDDMARLETQANATNTVFSEFMNWNDHLKKVKAAIPKKCMTPIRINEDEKEYHARNGLVRDWAYISYSTICKNRGGLWVYNVDTGQDVCGCRDMEGMNRLSIGQIKGRNGHILRGSFTFDWQDLMFRHTPGTGTIALEKKQSWHSSAMWLELGLMAAGLLAGVTGVGAPLAPLFFGAATAVGVADGAKYIKEGDTHMGVTLISLSLLGVGEVAAAFKTIKAESKIAKYVLENGEKGLKSLASKSINTPHLLTSYEKAVIQDLKIATFTLKETFSKEVAKKITTNAIKQLPVQAEKWSLKEVMKFGIHSLSTFKGMIIYIGTVPYTIDQIYLALYGNDSDRQRSGIGMLWNWLYAKGPIPNISNIDTGHWDKNDEYTNPQIDAEREKKLKDEILAKFIVETQATDAQEDMMNKLLDAFKKGDISVNDLMTDKQLEEWARNENIDTGFDREKYDELVAKQKEEEKRIKNLEGCNQLDSLKTLATGNDAIYVKIDDKITFVKAKIKAKSENKEGDFISGECNGEEFFYKVIEGGSFAERAQRDTKNLAQNPDYNETTPNFDSSIEKSNQTYAREFNKVNEDYRLQKIIRKNIKSYL